MGGGINLNEIVDHVIFHISSSHNSFEAFTCSKGNNKKVASGSLDQLMLHLPLAKGFNPDFDDDFRLEIPETLRGSSWFTKSTVERFLHIVNISGLLKNTIAIQNEINQLEDTRRFHLALYTKDNPTPIGDSSIENRFLEGGRTQEVILETVSSDATKNELLRALDLRVVALNEELVAIFGQALGNNCSKAEVSDLVAFVEHFGASDLRKSLFRYFSLYFHGELAEISNKYSASVSCDSESFSGKLIGERSPLSTQVETKDSVRIGISPAKIAQAERQSSTESEASSDSSDEVQTFVDRSRPPIRSASPRRSASPMRRVQIGRSGSRRSTALTIKSLNYIPARERALINREGDDNHSEDESSDQQLKRPENSVLRMSVQDRINLFEKKQRDQTPGSQKTNALTESSFGAKKAVLRRWSAGMGDSSTVNLHEDTGDVKIDTTHSNDHAIAQDKASIEEKPISQEIVNPTNVISLESENETSLPIDNPLIFLAPQSEETQSRAAASAEWTRQKETELNQMLMKMLENKSLKYASISSGSIRNQESCGEQKGDFYTQYKAKRYEKVQTGSDGKRTEKEGKFKVTWNKLDHKKSEMPSKEASVGGKLDSSAPSQKIRRNSAPQVIAKMSISNPAGSKKVSPRNPLAGSAGRNSLPSVPSQRTPPAKTTSGATIPNCRKPQLTPSPTRSVPQKERQMQPKVRKGTIIENKSNLKLQDEKKQKMVTKSIKNTKPKSVAPPADDSAATRAKPSLYSKATKKSSVVPLETKPFLRKGTGTISGIPILGKTKPVQSDDSSNNTENLIQAEKGSVYEAAHTMMQPPEEVLAELTSVDVNLEELPNINLSFEKIQDSDLFVPEMEEQIAIQLAEVPVVDTQADDELGIPSSAWVEVDQGMDPVSSESDPFQDATRADAASMTLSSPHIRHSLSQMLQAECMDPDVIEWGNAEIPPALIYQKDARRGFKRLLNFARKSKGESNVAGLSSPSVFSEGEEDTEEPKVINKENPDTSSRKAAFKTKATGLQRTMLSESYDGGNSIKSFTNRSGNHDFLSASMNSFPSVPHKLRDGRISATSSTKASRSFFSLSTFRSNKSREAKQH